PDEREDSVPPDCRRRLVPCRQPRGERRVVPPPRLLPAELLRSGPVVLPARAELLHAGTVVLPARTELLRAEPLLPPPLHPRLLPPSLPPSPRLLQPRLRSGLRLRSELLRRRADVRLQLVRLARGDAASRARFEPHLKRTEKTAAAMTAAAVFLLRAAECD